MIVTESQPGRTHLWTTQGTSSRHCRASQRLDRPRRRICGWGGQTVGREGVRTEIRPPNVPLPRSVALRTAHCCPVLLTPVSRRRFQPGAVRAVDVAGIADRASSRPPPGRPLRVGAFGAVNFTRPGGSHRQSRTQPRWRYAFDAESRRAYPFYSQGGLSRRYCRRPFLHTAGRRREWFCPESPLRLSRRRWRSPPPSPDRRCTGSLHRILRGHPQPQTREQEQFKFADDILSAITGCCGRTGATDSRRSGAS